LLKLLVDYVYLLKDIGTTPVKKRKKEEEGKGKEGERMPIFCCAYLYV